MLGLLLNFAIWTVAIFTSAFIFWRKLYPELEELVLWSLLLKNFFWTLVFGRLIWWIWAAIFNQAVVSWLWQINQHPGFDLIGGIFGGIIVINLSNPPQKSIVSELGDVWVESYGWGVALVAIGGWLVTWQFSNWIIPIISVAGLLLWYTLKYNYRRWLWYRSGKVGFLWWSGAAIISICQILIANQTITNFSRPIIFTNLYLIFFLLTCIIGLYKLSARQLPQDYLQIFHWLKIRWIVTIQLIRRYKNQ